MWIKYTTKRELALYIVTSPAPRSPRRWSREWNFAYKIWTLLLMRKQRMWPMAQSPTATTKHFISFWSVSESWNAVEPSGRYRKTLQNWQPQSDRRKGLSGLNSMQFKTRHGFKRRREPPWRGYRALYCDVKFWQCKSTAEFKSSKLAILPVRSNGSTWLGSSRAAQPHCSAAWLVTETARSESAGENCRSADTGGRWISLLSVCASWELLESGTSIGPGWSRDRCLPKAGFEPG